MNYSMQRHFKPCAQIGKLDIFICWNSNSERLLKRARTVCFIRWIWDLFSRFEGMLNEWIIQCNGILCHSRGKLDIFICWNSNSERLLKIARRELLVQYSHCATAQRQKVFKERKQNFNEMGVFKRIFPCLRITEVNIRKTKVDIQFNSW